MKLVITEKPSVAKSISAVLGADKRRDGYCEGGNFLVSWCFGHLAELASAEVYDEAYARWSREQLPIIPESWQYSVGRDKKKQLDLLTELMRRSDVTEIINACDAGREGELIFRTVYLLAGCVKPVKRLWISSMEDAAIREGFENLRDGSEYDHLYDAALCRSKADWLVGINATRLFSVLYHRTLNVGRVVSPTLALLVQREAEIKAFQPEPFYTVKLDNGDFAAVSEKLKSKPDAESLKSACAGAPAVIRSVEQKEKSEKAPALYDLTTLQRDANRILGFTAQQTLDYLQSLYEKKLCMDAALAKKPHDLEGFYSLMEQAGYTVTRGKNITFSHPRQKRNIRMRSLPEEYREDVIREVLAGRRIHNPRKRRSPLAEQKAQLVSSLEAKQNQGRGRSYDLSIQNQITKQQAKALLYYQQHGFTSADDFDAFAESVEAVKQHRDTLSAQITSAEKRLNEIAVLQKHITNYLKTKDIYAGYRASGYSKAYYEEHEDAIKLCKASKRAFDELLPSDTSGKTAGSHKKQLPSLKALRAEYAELLAMKKAAYPEYYRAKDEYRELLTYQANLAGLFGIENVRSAPQREHQQEEK